MKINYYLFSRNWCAIWKQAQQSKPRKQKTESKILKRLRMKDHQMNESRPPYPANRGEEDILITKLASATRQESMMDPFPIFQLQITVNIIMGLLSIALGIIAFLAAGKPKPPEGIKKMKPPGCNHTNQFGFDDQLWDVGSECSKNTALFNNCPVQLIRNSGGGFTFIQSMIALLTYVLFAILIFVIGLCASYKTVQRRRERQMMKGVQDDPVWTDYVTVFLGLIKIAIVGNAIFRIGPVEKMCKQYATTPCPDPYRQQEFIIMCKQVNSSYSTSCANISTDCLTFLNAAYQLYNRVSSARALHDRMVVDRRGRHAVRFTVPAKPPDGIFKTKIFCATYSFELPADVAAGTDIYIFEDGEVSTGFERPSVTEGENAAPR